MTKAQQLGITKFPYNEYDEKGNGTYFEDSDGFWYKSEYDANGNRTYFENSKGFIKDNRPKIMTKAIEKGITDFPYKERDANGNVTYTEYSDGVWCKWEFDFNGNETYYEDYEGFWWKSKYGANGNETYYEDSDGVIIDNRPFFTKFAAWLKRSLKRSKAAKQ